ncbi:hypothetical protein AB0D07_35695 [Streptomyces globisporus]|uniref:tetratricopeptide repeat protein n=1 Tax=Streptomyces globisporus TaxID=1908 RepID=UPI000BF0499B
MRGEAGDRDGAEALARQAADLGSPDALMRLGEMRESTDRDGAEVLYRQAADLGSAHALDRLTVMRENAGDRDGAEALSREAANHASNSAWSRIAGKPSILTRLWPYGLDPDGTPTTP